MSFEGLVLSHLKAITRPSWTPVVCSQCSQCNPPLHPPAPWPPRNLRQHLVCGQLRLNTIIPAFLQDKLPQLSVPDSICRRVTDRSQHPKLWKHVPGSQTVSNGSLQDCVLSPLLIFLYISSYYSSHQSVKLLKSTDNTTVIRLISDGDKP